MRDQTIFETKGEKKKRLLLEELDRKRKKEEEEFERKHAQSLPAPNCGWPCFYNNYSMLPLCWNFEFPQVYLPEGFPSFYTR